MEYKKLGKTNLKISRIGFGCWEIGGYGWGKIKDQDSIKSIHKALELGVNFFDTADIYGLGHSEKILSKALGSYRKKVVIATKFGLKWNKKKNSSERDLSSKHIIKAVEDSLKRLKINCIPLYQIHYPDPKTPIQETMETLKKLKKQGKIQHVGCSNFDTDILQEAQKFDRIESIQMPYNIIEHNNIVKDTFNVYNKHKISLITYGPLAQGLLSGKYDADTKFGKNDIRSQEQYINFHGERFKANLEILKKIKELALKYDKTCSQVAIRWVLEDNFITSCLVGIKNKEQIINNVKSLNWKLEEKDKEMLTSCTINIYKKNNLS